MVCLSCDEQADRAYYRLIGRKLSTYFENNPCVDCGETDPVLLDFTNGAPIWKMIEDRTPWVKVNTVIQKRESICVGCERRRLAERSGGPWGFSYTN